MIKKITIMKQILLAILFISCVSLKKVDNENTAILDLQTLLMSKDWGLIGDDKEDTTIKYTKTEEVFYYKGKISSKRKYYISKTSCDGKTYDSSKLSSETNGNYFMAEDSDCESVVIENDNKIIFHHLYDAGAPTFTIIAK